MDRGTPITKHLPITRDASIVHLNGLTNEQENTYHHSKQTLRSNIDLKHLSCNFFQLSTKDIDFVFGYECEVKHLFEIKYIPELKEVLGDGFRGVIFQCT
jgi:hypothetical protein